MSDDAPLDPSILAKLGINTDSLNNTDEKWEIKATNEKVDTQADILSKLGLSMNEGNNVSEEAWEKKATTERSESIEISNDIMSQLGIDATELDDGEKWEKKGNVDI